MNIHDDNRPVWSRSQIATLKECRRKFFFQYKSEMLPSDAPPSTLGIPRLKQLKNRYLWAGSLVHDVVGTIIKSVRQGEAPPAEEELVPQVLERMRQEFRGSKEGTAGNPQLLEHYYDVGVTSETWRNHWQTVETCLRWFLGSRWLERLCALKPETWKVVDETLSFDVDGTRAYVKIDCAIESGDRFYLIDWKTSSPTPSAEENLQMMALYAQELWGAKPSHIDAFAVSLRDGQTHHALISEESLAGIRSKVVREAAEIREAALALGPDPFLVEPPRHRSLCFRCQFHKVCDPLAALSIVPGLPSLSPGQEVYHAI